jgi:RNA polymerase sigma factor (sigma-70 family)
MKRNGEYFRFKKGDRALCREICGKYCNYFIKWSRRYLEDEEAARDIYNDAILLGLEKVKSHSFTEPKCNVGTWLCRIAKNILMDQIKHCRCHEKYCDEALYSHLQTETNSGEAALYQETLRDKIREMYALLSFDEQQLIRWFYCEKRSLGFIARVLHKKPAAIAMWKCRVVKKITDHFKDDKDVKGWMG